MNDVLPSYEAANTRDYWSIIARYISSADLCSAALVCKQWAAIFTRQLWGNPASHFGVENDVVYGAFFSTLSAFLLIADPPMQSPSFVSGGRSGGPG